MIWGTSDVVGKLALDSVPPTTLAALRFGVALAVLWVIARRQGGPGVPARVAAPLGLLGVAVCFFLQNLGLSRTEASNASLLQGAAPVITLVMAALLLGERLGGRRLLSVGFAILGVAAVTLPGKDGLQVPGLGDVMILASTGCFATFVVLGRRAFPVYGTFPVLAAMAKWGVAALTPAAAIELWYTRPVEFGASQIGLVLYLGVGCSAVTYALWGFALCRFEAGSAATFDAVIPVVGVVAAVLVLRESPTNWHIFGGICVVGAICLSLRDTEEFPVSIAPAAQFQSGVVALAPGTT
jgi:drug/metabolite transporter (DMT)-like permease